MSRLEVDPASYEAKDDVYSAFVNFCRERKLPTVDKSSFGAQLPRYAPMKVERKKLFGTRIQCWRGIRLREERAYHCKGGGAKFHTLTELSSHRAHCDDFQLMQAREAAERREEE